MSLEVLTMGGGGGESASIFVTGLSESDIVTASNGNKAKTAVWNSAESRFEINRIKDYGMWTVTATNGEDAAEQDVLVDAAIEYEIDMGYATNYLMLYDAGDECEDVTGGWVKGYKSNGSGGTFTKNSDSFYVKSANGTNYAECGTGTANLVNIEGYSKIHVNALSITLGTVNTATAAYGVYLSTNSPVFNSVTAYVNFTVKGLSSMDVSAVKDPQYVYVAGFPTTGSCTFNAVFLTKEDDWQTLCSIAGISAPSDLATLIADTTRIAIILADKNAVNYMVSKCTGDFMASFVASAACLSSLDASPHKDIVFANKHWAKFLAMVGVTA